MAVLKFLGRGLIYLMIFTLLGQLRWNGYSFENYYHDAVNSSTAQNTWATLTAPFKWVGARFGLAGDTTRAR